MKIEHGFLEIGNWVFGFINDWQQLWGKWNWVTCHLFHIYFEKESMVGRSYEFEFALLGLGFYIRYTPEISEEIKTRINEIHKELLNDK